MRKVISMLFIFFFFQSFSQDDIILILGDDLPNKITSSTGAPLFVQTPNIDRIKNNGMNFPNNYCVVSLCAPSRAVLITGHYPSITGVKSNSTTDDFNMSLETLGKKLKQAGYYTACIGKFDSIFDKHTTDWSYQLKTNATQTSPKIKWMLNGAKPKLVGDTMITNTIVDSAMAILNRRSEPTFIILSLKVPHTPHEVPLPFDTMYANNTIPFGADTVRYEDLVPSWIYDMPLKNYKTPSQMIPLLYGQYRAMAHFDFKLGQLFNFIDSGSMIIFTSDNGYMNGEHGLYSKRWALKQAVEVQLHIWYKEWFPTPGESSILTASVDLWATILHAAGVNHSGSQGYSIKDLYDGIQTRQLAYYSMGYTPEDNNGKMAASKAVWDSSYKLIKYNCTQLTEQFFNLQDDSLEMVNKINEPSLQDTINFYRNKLVELSIQYGDTVPETVINCNLINN